MPSPNFRNRIRGHRKNFETGPRLSNSLPQREGARLPPGSRRASRLLFQGFHPVPGALWAGRLSSPQTACGAARQLFGGSGTATRRPTGRVRWVMWRRCRTCPRCATLETPPGLRGIGRTSPYLMLPRRRRRRLLGVGNHMCWGGPPGGRSERPAGASHGGRFRLCAVVGRQGWVQSATSLMRVCERVGSLPPGCRKGGLGARGVRQRPRQPYTDLHWLPPLTLARSRAAHPGDAALPARHHNKRGEQRPDGRSRAAADLEQRLGETPAARRRPCVPPAMIQGETPTNRRRRVPRQTKSSDFGEL